MECKKREIETIEQLIESLQRIAKEHPGIEIGLEDDSDMLRYFSAVDVEVFWHERENKYCLHIR
jgi:hypothetical protein